jgi:hypothetical protein
MRTPYDDADGFEFSDSWAVRRIIQEQKREEMRHAKRRISRGPGDHEPGDSFDDDDDYDDFDDYEDYDEDEFDSSVGLTIDH